MRSAGLAAICLAMLATGQATAAEQPERVTVGMVDPTNFPTIDTSVVVNDPVGLPVTGLTDSNFSVIEDGKSVPVQSVHTVTNLPATMTAILVLDTSGSMSGAPLSDAVAAVNTFVDQVGPDAQVGGVSLGGKCEVDPGPGLSQDKAAAKEFFAGARAGGDTPLYDATLTALQQSLAAPHGRRMVIVLTDGEDTCSKVSIDTLVNAAIHNGVPITLIGLGPDIRSDVLQNLANLTGGQFLPAADSSRLAAIYDELSVRLRTQYALQFRSSQFADRHEHAFSVQVKTASGETASVARFTTPSITSMPHLSLSSGQKISGPTTFEITNQSPVQLSRADVYLDDTLLESLSGTSLTYTLDPTGLSSGSRTVRVHVWDSAAAETDVSVPVEFTDTGLFGLIPFWVILAVVLALPVLAVVGIVLHNGRRRRLRCTNCHRLLQAAWAACPYCSQPDPGPIAAISSRVPNSRPR
jgi:VWFA-related protein